MRPPCGPHPRDFPQPRGTPSIRPPFPVPSPLTAPVTPALPCPAGTGSSRSRRADRASCSAHVLEGSGKLRDSCRREADLLRPRPLPALRRSRGTLETSGFSCSSLVVVTFLLMVLLTKWIMHVTALILMDSSPGKTPLHIPCSLAVSESKWTFRSCLTLISYEQYHPLIVSAF